MGGPSIVTEQNRKNIYYSQFEFTVARQFVN